MDQPEQPTIEYVERTDGVRLACRYRPRTDSDDRRPTILFLPGYMSDMDGGKAIALDAWAAAQGRAILRFDYSGCGASEGDFRAGTLDIWRDDALAVMDALVAGPVVLVGSSMGGWIALLVAQAYGPQWVSAIVGIAAAPDFTSWGFTDDQKAEILATGALEEPSDYSDTPYVTTRDFWQSGQANLLLGGAPIAIDCPVRLLHGQADSVVPGDIALRLAAALRSSDVQTLLIKDGDHRLSRDADIALLVRTVANLPEYP